MKISFANLTYTKNGYSSNCFPYAVALVGSYLKKNSKEDIDIDIFQYPEDFTEYLNNNTPKFACFSCYSWTCDISHEYAKKIKEKSPETIIVFGGPNFPLEVSEQKRFLEKYPGIDFYIRGEGEIAFLELFRALEKYGLDKDKYKKSLEKTGNVTYIQDNELISGEMIPRMNNLDDTPSPYLNGMLDKFFDNVLIPLVQAARGCPFSCAYCQEGQKYFCVVKRFSNERIVRELEYIAKKAKVPNLNLADSNFGMYKEDIELCKEIARLKKDMNWPKYIEGSSGKNERAVLDCVKYLEGGITLAAPVQSTDEKVLDAIHRKNISMDIIIEIAKMAEHYGGKSFSEIILGLPNDTKEAHFKSMFDMVDLGINVVRSHQFLILPGSELSTKESLEKYDMQTRFRIQPRCFGNYDIYDDTVACAEIDELCIGNSTMSYLDYLECRKLDLTIEIFYNDNVIYELINFIKSQDVLPSLLLRRIHEKTMEPKIKEVYDGYIKENEDSLWKSEQELKVHIKNKDMIEKYLNENLRNNEQLKYKALAFFHKMKEVHEIAFDSAREILKEKGKYNDEIKEYLDELFDFSLSRKKELLNLDINENKRFNFDFIGLSNKRFKGEIKSFRQKEPITIEFFHTKEQKELFENYKKQFGRTINQIGTMLSRSKADSFYREYRKF